MSARAEPGHGESGFTVVELAITMAISMIVMGSILGILDSQTRAERRVSTFADNQEVIRQAVVAMQRDIRSSEPLAELPGSATQYALRIDLSVFEDILDPNPVSIRWRVDIAAKELVRETLDATGAVTGVTHRLTGVTNNFGSPLFTFYDAVQLPYDLTLTTPKTISDCTVRIRTRLVAAPTAGPAPAVLISDTQLRNRLPGGSVGCPGWQP